MSYQFKDFEADFEKVMINVCRGFEEFPWENKEAYARWCAHTYYYVCHSTRLLALAAARCPLALNSYHRRFIDHLGEEKGHEKLSLNDLKAIGCDIADYEELPETALFYQSQYYQIDYHGPMAFFGWILTLEGGAVKACGNAYKRVAQAHGAKAGSFLSIHSDEDIDHLDKALSMVKNLGSDELEAVAKNLHQSSELYISIFRKIATLSQAAADKKAA